jgi:hypothetical protein
LQLRGFDQPLQRGPDITLGTLVAVIDGGIENVDAGAQPGFNGGNVGLVGGIAGLANIRSQSDGGQPEFAHSRYMFSLAEVASVAQCREAVAIASRAACGGASGKHRKSV